MSLCEECSRYGEHGDQGKLKCPQFKLDKDSPYFDKGNHKERSKFHAPAHLKFWKKKEKDDITKTSS